MMVRFGEAGKEFENTYMVALYFPCVFFREGVFMVAMVPVLHLGTSLTHFYRPQTKFEKVVFSQVSVCPWGGLGLCPGGSPSRGVVSVQWGLHPGGSPSREVSVQGVSAQGVSVQGAFVQGGLC